MAPRSTPVDRRTLRADRQTLRALTMLPDYRPINSACSIEALLRLEQSLTQVELDELRLLEAFARARLALQECGDLRVAIAKELHAAILAAKDQVKAQYGDDSLAISQIGLTRRSERKRVGRPRSARP